MDVFGNDALGHPLLVHRIGELEPAELLTECGGAFEVAAMQRQYVRDFELIGAHKREIGAERGAMIYKHVAIIDLSGFGTKHMGSAFRGPVKETIDLSQYFYPECLWKMFIINAPWIFSALWRVVSPWLDPVTKTKIHVLKGDFLTEMQQNDIPLDALPVSLGGTMEDDEGMLATKCKE